MLRLRNSVKLGSIRQLDALDSSINTVRDLRTRLPHSVTFAFTRHAITLCTAVNSTDDRRRCVNGRKNVHDDVTVPGPSPVFHSLSFRCLATTCFPECGARKFVPRPAKQPERWHILPRILVRE